MAGEQLGGASGAGVPGRRRQGAAKRGWGGGNEYFKRKKFAMTLKRRSA